MGQMASGKLDGPFGIAGAGASEKFGNVAEADQHLGGAGGIQAQQIAGFELA